ncbi:MAG: hypothetical protein HY549_10585 [Elusimicrobia bacterium]|nr:hypothetical protein [Elusimicrobiota bacterium]
MKSHRCSKLALMTLSILGAAWFMIPLVNSVRHLCPTRPTGVPEAQAIAAWARKYGVGCNVCHVAGYKLTGAGQKFLRQGHTMPGSDKEANISDFLSLTAKIRTWGKKTTVVEEARETQKTSKSSFEFHALSLYSGGALDRGFSYFAEFYLHENEKKFTPTASEANVSDMGDWGRSKLAEAYLAYNYNLNEDVYAGGRMGRIMPWLIHFHGGGARLDYSRPLPFTSQTQTNNPYRPFSRQYGASAFGAFKDLFAELGIVNGTGKHENIVEVETDNKKDVYLTLDYTFDGNGSMLGAYYYKGYWPLHWFSQAASGDKFRQYGLIGNYTFKLSPFGLDRAGGSLIGACFIGNDRYKNTGGVNEDNHRSKSYFVETQAHLFDDMLAPYFRYEWFDSNTALPNTEKYGPVLGLNWKAFNHGRFVLEYSRYKTRNNFQKYTRDEDVTLEAQFMF